MDLLVSEKKRREAKGHAQAMMHWHAFSSTLKEEIAEMFQHTGEVDLDYVALRTTTTRPFKWYRGWRGATESSLWAFLLSNANARLKEVSSRIAHVALVNVEALPVKKSGTEKTMHDALLNIWAAAEEWDDPDLYGVVVKITVVYSLEQTCEPASVK